MPHLPLPVRALEVAVAVSGDVAQGGGEAAIVQRSGDGLRRDGLGSLGRPGPDLDCGVGADAARQRAQAIGPEQRCCTTWNGRYLQP